MVVAVFGVGYPDEKVAPVVGRQSLRISVNIKRYLGNGGRVRIDYTAVRGNIELYAQDQFYIMIKSDGGSSKLSQYVEKYRTDGGQKASEAINEWYYGK